jgi:hypothetical protein
MAQLFRPQDNARFRIAIVAALAAVIGTGGILLAYSHSGQAWDVGKTASQPIPFRHDLHAGRLGLDCRYCHSSVERASAAGMPSVQTCMTCHSQVLQGASVLEPLRTSLAFDQPLVWNSVHRLPPFARFHHGIHITKGVACETCHGKVETMQQTEKTQTLSMGWCLDCHRNPGPHLSLTEAAHAMSLTQADPAKPVDPIKAHAAAIDRLTSCSTCHY